MVSTSKFKTSGILFLFSSLTVPPCQMPTPKTPPPNRAKKEEKKVCRFGDHYRLSLSLSLSPFFSSVYFCLFRNFPSQTKRENKTVDGSSFTSILIIDAVREREMWHCRIVKVRESGQKQPRDTTTVCRPILPSLSRIRIPKCAGKQRLAIEERKDRRRGYFCPCGICLPSLPSPTDRPSFKHSFSFVALLEGYLTAIQLGRSGLARSQ